MNVRKETSVVKNSNVVLLTAVVMLTYLIYKIRIHPNFVRVL